MTLSASPASTSPSHAGLLDLPNELLNKILSKLPFQALLHTSRTSRRIYDLACADRTLWQRLPVVDAVTLHLIQPFIERSSVLGFELPIARILISDLPQICPFVHNNLPRLQSLRLTFIESEVEIPPIEDAPTLLNDALSRPAPLLRFLALNGFFYVPLGPLRPDILRGVVAPVLSELHLTAFEFEGACAAFAGVEIVVTSVGALAPLPDAAQNTAVHALFPALQHLELRDIDFDHDAEPEDYYAVTRVPAIDRPLLSLILSWHRSISPVDDLQDGPSVAWIEGAMPHVEYLDVTYDECPAAWQLVLTSVAPTASSLCITPNDAATLELQLCSFERNICRTVSVTPSQAQKALLREEFANLETLAVSTDGTCIDLLRARSWGALPRLCVLYLLVDWNSVIPTQPDGGSFIEPATLDVIPPLKNVRVLCLQAHADWQREKIIRSRSVSAQFVLDFIKRVTPNVTRVNIDEVEVSGTAVFAGHPLCKFSYCSLN